MDTNLSNHPGGYIKAQVMPKGLSVKAAAELLDVGRPALSNLLNGNADLSSDMAARLERAFGVSAQELMDRQAAYDAAQAKSSGAPASTKKYVPDFLSIKVKEIEAWASSLAARSRLAVFLRTLVNSTGVDLTKVDFPGNDDAERPGWDGYVSRPRGLRGFRSGNPAGNLAAAKTRRRRLPTTTSSARRRSPRRTARRPHSSL